MEAILEFFKNLLNIIVGISGWGLYISFIPGVALIWILPTVFLIVSFIRYKRATDNQEKYKKLLRIAFMTYIVCILLFIALMIYTMFEFSNSYPPM